MYYFLHGSTKFFFVLLLVSWFTSFCSLLLFLFLPAQLPFDVRNSSLSQDYTWIHDDKVLFCVICFYVICNMMMVRPYARSNIHDCVGGVGFCFNGVIKGEKEKTETQNIKEGSGRQIAACCFLVTLYTVTNAEITTTSETATLLAAFNKKNCVAQSFRERDILHIDLG